MSEELKKALRKSKSGAHVEEFGHCVGIVQGLTDYNNKGEPYDPAKLGPEVDVRWQPSGLRYGYDPQYLIEVKSMRLTEKQKELLQWLRKKGADHRGRWVPGLPKNSIRTLTSLVRRGAVEERSIPLPRSKWPKKDRRSLMTVSFGRLEFRISPHWLKSHMPS